MKKYIARVVFPANPNKEYDYLISERQVARYHKVLEVRQVVYGAVISGSFFPSIVFIKSIREADEDIDRWKLKKIYGVVM